MDVARLNEALRHACSAAEAEESILPAGGSSGKEALVCAGLSQRFLVTGSRKGVVTHYNVGSLAMVNEFKHNGECAAGGVVLKQLFSPGRG